MFRHLRDGEGIAKCSRDDVIQFFDGISEHNGTSDIRSDYKDVMSVAKYIKDRWIQSHRTLHVFMAKQEAWLEQTVCLSHPLCVPPASTSAGRPSLPFSAKRRRTKLTATAELRRRHCSEELVFSAASAVHQTGRRKAARLMAAAGSPSRGPRLAEQLDSLATPACSRYSAEEALGLMVDMDLTKSQYKTMQQSAKFEKGDRLYPPYNAVAKAKSACLPPAAAISVAPDRAGTTLQALLDHTATRILQLQAEVVTRIGAEDKPVELKLVSKWGMDGSTGHSQYKQGGMKAADDQLFVVSLVPLRLVSKRGDVVWSNRTPSSARFCRPISIQYVKETAALAADTASQMEREITDLAPLQTSSAVISYQLHMTMADGKVINAVTGTLSSQTCSICGVTPRDMNNLDAVCARPVSNVQYGISTMHCWIRVFEAILRIAYRLRLRKRTARSGEEKQQVEEAKREVQKKLRDRLGLRVDEPRAGGAGNSNDGNTARRAFRSTKEFAACTGMDEVFVGRVHVILQAVSSFHPVNSAALGDYCRQTAELYVELYGWYHMPVTLHKLLIHSATVVEWCHLPLGTMSEEAAESGHKQVRKFRLKHTRKDSRLHAISDLYSYLLVSTDPVISSRAASRRHRQYRTKTGQLLPETLALLEEPELPSGRQEHRSSPCNSSCDSDSSCDSESDSARGCDSDSSCDSDSNCDDSDV